MHFQTYAGLMIAHELAHIFLHNSDEQRVDDQTLSWIKTARKETVLVQIATGFAPRILTSSNFDIRRPLGCKILPL
jgi:Zn-dependent peptidase ImmA (M78 family)